MENGKISINNFLQRNIKENELMSINSRAKTREFLCSLNKTK